MDEIITIVVCVKKRPGYELTIDKVYNVYKSQSNSKYIITDDDVQLYPYENNFISIVEYRERNINETNKP